MSERICLNPMGTHRRFEPQRTAYSRTVPHYFTAVVADDKIAGTPWVRASPTTAANLDWRAGERDNTALRLLLAWSYLVPIYNAGAPQAPVSGSKSREFGLGDLTVAWEDMVSGQVRGSLTIGPEYLPAFTVTDGFASASPWWLVSGSVQWTGFRWAGPATGATRLAICAVDVTISLGGNPSFPDDTSYWQSEFFTPGIEGQSFTNNWQMAWAPPYGTAADSDWGTGAQVPFAPTYEPRYDAIVRVSTTVSGQTWTAEGGPMGAYPAVPASDGGEIRLTQADVELPYTRLPRAG